MSSLTTIFNHLYVYLIYLLSFLGILPEKDFWDVFNSSQLIIASHVENCIETFFPNFEPVHRPILFLFVGIFALGSIIGLVKRLIR